MSSRDRVWIEPMREPEQSAADARRQQVADDAEAVRDDDQDEDDHGSPSNGCWIGRAGGSTPAAFKHSRQTARPQAELPTTW